MFERDQRHQLLAIDDGALFINHDEPVLPDGVPACPDHLEGEARAEWFRLVGPLHEAGVLTTIDRGALAAYAQAWCRWVESENKLKSTPTLMKTPSGYVQRNPWLGIANKQLELMGRYMVELGMTPSARSWIKVAGPAAPEPLEIVFRTFYEASDGTQTERHRDLPYLDPAKVKPVGGQS